MPEDADPLGLDPHEYHGVALNLPAERIPEALAREIARVGRLELWQFQAFHNHDHPYLSGDADAVEREAALARAWAVRLRERLPRLRLVVSTDPLSSMTWYQATKDAPIADDEAFAEYSTPAEYRFTKAVREAVPPGLSDEERRRELGRLARVGFPPRTGGVGPCEKCGAEGRLSPPFPAPTHRGVRLVECGACGARLVHSTRTVRDVVEPTEVG